jgi:hypothetical protein
MLARAMALARLPFRKASLVRVLWSLPLFVLPGIRCQNSTQLRGDGDATVGGSVRGDADQPMDGGRAALHGHGNGSDTRLEACGWVRRSYDVIAHSSDTRSRTVEQLWLSPTVLGRKSTGRDRMRRGAYQAHPVQVKSTEKALMGAIHRLRLNDQRVTMTAAASQVGMSLENVCRRYR